MPTEAARRERETGSRRRGRRHGPRSRRGGAGRRLLPRPSSVIVCQAVPFGVEAGAHRRKEDGSPKLHYCSVPECFRLTRSRYCGFHWQAMKDRRKENEGGMTMREMRKEREKANGNKDR